MRLKQAKGECVCACTCLRRAARAVTRAYDEAFRPMGYRVTQVAVLNVLAELGPITVSELAQESVTDRTTLTRNLRLLEKKGLICLECGEDRRERRVCMTQQGAKVVKQAQPVWASVQKKVIAQVGSKRFKRMVADLSEMVEAAKHCCP